MLDDGGEVDLDLGNYERFLNVSLSRDNNITTGSSREDLEQKYETRAGNFCVEYPSPIISISTNGTYEFHVESFLIFLFKYPQSG